MEDNNSVSVKQEERLAELERDQPTNSNGLRGDMKRRKVLQAAVGGAALAVAGQTASANTGTHVEVGDNFEDKDLYVDPALDIDANSAFASATNHTDPAAVDLALIATETDLGYDSVYDFLGSEVPVSLIGENAHVIGVDYLTEGKHSIGGQRLMDVGEIASSPSQEEISLASDLGYNCGFELSPHRSSSSMVLYPQGKSLNSHIFYDNPDEKMADTTTLVEETMADVRQVLDTEAKIESLTDVGAQDDDQERGEEDDYRCPDGVECIGRFTANGSRSGGNWSKTIIGGVYQGSNASTWGFDNRAMMNPNRSGWLNPWYRNSSYEREVIGDSRFNRNNKVLDSGPGPASDVESMYYEANFSTGDSGFTLGATTEAAPMSIQREEEQEFKIWHRFHDFDSANEKNSIDLEPLYVFESDFTTSIRYDYEDRISWRRNHTGWQSKEDLDGFGFWAVWQN